MNKKYDKMYINRSESFFDIHDTRNSERLYNYLTGGENNEQNFSFCYRKNK